MGEQVPWPPPPREPGPWGGGPPVAPPGNTPLPPLPGSGGTMGGTHGASNPWNQQVPSVIIPPDRPDPSAPPPAPPAAPAAIADRAPTWLLVASVVVVLAMIAGGAYLVLKGGRQYPSAWDERSKPVADWVAEARELEFEHPVQVNFLSEEEYTARATEGGDPANPDNAQYYEDQAAQLRALGFLTGDVDLAEANDTLSDSGTLAFYDPSSEQVFVRGTELTPAVRVTLAHELVHVLQDQHFDLERLQDFEDGRGAVLRAIAEGDATRIEDRYVEEVLTDEERTAYQEESTTAGEEASEELEAKVPPILSTVFAAPYILGPELVAALDAKGGSEAIDRALEDPPTEEVLFDPRTFETDAAGPMTVDVEAPEGAEIITESEFGPTTWYLMLAARMEPGVALAATDGWGGDQYVVYREDDQVCVAVDAKGDTEEDTDALANALVTWVAGSPEDTASAERVDDLVRFRSCDPGAEAETDATDVTPEILVVPVTRTQVYTGEIEADATPAQASCFAQGVVDAFTLEQLTDPEGTFIISDEGQRLLGELRAGCA